MKKIFIIAYSKINLGDDLFVDILVNRYKNVQFYTRAIEKGTYIYEKNENLHYKNYTLDDLLFKATDEFDAIVYIGGSIFMEHAGGIGRIKKLSNIAIKYKKNNKPFFFLSSNFGPYKSQEYKKEAEILFSNITDICFREKKSYEQFKHIKTVRYAPDVVFSYCKPYKRLTNTVGISVINFKYRDDIKQYENQYYDVIRNSIFRYIESGKKVTLFSFCKYEGDEETIGTLIEKFPIEISKNIYVEKYNGNLDEFIRRYSSMEFIICSRFHSMILSAVFKQKLAILSYSKKINNVIYDLCLCKKCINISEINTISNIEIKDFEDVKMDEKIKLEAEKQFKEFDRFIKI